LQRPLWVVMERDDKLVATRYAAGDVTRPVDEVTAPAAGVVDELCRVEKCAVPPAVLAPNPAPTAPSVTSAPVEPLRPRKPVWKRAWFWAVVSVGVLAVAGAATGTALGLTAARDYDVRVR
jgi:hypothetical protein